MNLIPIEALPLNITVIISKLIANRRKLHFRNVQEGVN
jgi:hypothetical protein